MPENIDNIICAKIPRGPSASTREENFSEEGKFAQEYYHRIKECMLHGPCRPQFGWYHYTCHQNGKCVNKIPTNLSQIQSWERTHSHNIAKEVNKMVVML